MAQSMVNQQLELWQVLESFACRQQEQEQGFLAGREQEELDRWFEERQQLFASLRHHLEQVLPQATLSRAEALRLREKIGELLAGEQRLAAVAGRRRVEVSDQLGRLRKGRIGLNGYRFCDKLAGGPRFVSSKG